MADDVGGKPARVAPDIQQSATKLRDEAHKYYGEANLPPTAIDMVTLTQNLASVAAPLYRDVEATFANSQLARIHHPEANLSES